MLIQATPYGKLSTARLPKEYQEVEYIQSSGTQYIDTGVVATSGFEMETKIEFAQTSEYYATICGAHEPSAPYKRNFVAYEPSVSKIEIDAGDIITATAVTLNSGTNIIKASNVSNAFYLFINDVQYPVTGGATTAYSSRNLYLLWCNGYDLGAPTAGKLYYHKLRPHGSNLEHYFVPCFRKSDNAGGVYDLATGDFHGNAGSGSFVIGPNVNNSGGGGNDSFLYTGNYNDNRINNKGIVRLNSSGILTVEKTTTVIAAIVGAGGGGVYSSNSGLNSASGGGGGYQTVEVTLEPGTYEIIIGTGGNGLTTIYNNVTATAGGNTIAFGYTSTGGSGASGGISSIAGGEGGTPNGNDGTGGEYATGGEPNGGASTGSTAAACNGGDGYVELTFI